MFDYEKIYTFEGDRPGKTAVIIGGVHGNEVCGVQFLENFLESNPKIQSGKLIVLFGNPKAIEQNLRFVDVNLNRLFRTEEELSEKEKNSYEYGRMKSIKPVLESADILLDIHSSASIEATPFIICEQNSVDIAKRLPFTRICSGWDEIQPGGADYFMNSIGKQGICIECGSNTDPENFKRTELAVKAFLETIGLKEGNTENTPEKKFLRIFMQYKTKTHFMPEKVFADFEYVQKDQELGRDGDEVIRAPENAYILFSRERKNPNEEAFLLGELLPLPTHNDVGHYKD